MTDGDYDAIDPASADLRIKLAIKTSLQPCDQKDCDPVKWLKKNSGESTCRDCLEQNRMKEEADEEEGQVLCELCENPVRRRRGGIGDYYEREQGAAAAEAQQVRDHLFAAEQQLHQINREINESLNRGNAAHEAATKAVARFCCRYSRKGWCWYYQNCKYLHEKAERIPILSSNMNCSFECERIITRGGCKHVSTTGHIGKNQHL